MTNRSKRKLRFVAGFALYFAALWLLWETPVVYPLKIFVVLLHEVSHAMVAVATGGSIERITLDPLQGGACHCPGGNAFLTLSAGYLGSLVWGGLMLAAARTNRIKSEWVNLLIGGLVIGLTLLYVRNGFGFAFGILFGLALIGVSRKLGDGVNRPLLLTLGLTSALYAILDIKSDVLDRPEVRSDAYMLAEITGVPTLVWGVLWIGAALAFSFWLLRRAYRGA
ncbi:MAG: M50 family metallopeptidase [Gemmatimonadetes bacterium]|nr:M50 family metallopeptidase [Gemmatimonadota bacterium]